MRGKRLKLIGQRFGKLLVINFVGIGKHGRTLWNCLCDCGNKKIVPADHLTRGGTKSCGCLYGKTEKIGTRYGKLVIIERAKRIKKGPWFWRCKCDCGNIVVVWKCENIDEFRGNKL